MFKISKGFAKDTFKIDRFLYISEANFYTLVYSIDNKTEEEVAQLMQGRIQKTDDLDWALYTVKFTSCDALIDNTGHIKPVPVKERNTNERQRLRRDRSGPGDSGEILSTEEV